MEDFVGDVRYGLRSLIHSPGFALVTILTLGLGIGANTAVFSLISGVVLKPLPYANADRLVLIQQSAPLAARPNVGVSVKELYDYRDQATDFDEIVEYHGMSFDLLRRGEPDRVSTGVVSHNFFDVLGIKPILGRYAQRLRPPEARGLARDRRRLGRPYLPPLHRRESRRLSTGLGLHGLGAGCPGAAHRERAAHAPDPARDYRSGPADRLRQRRESHSGPGPEARPGAGAPRCSGGRSRPARASVADRKLAGGACRWSGRPRLRHLGSRTAHSIRGSLHGSNRRDRDRLERSGLHPRGHRGHRSVLRHSPCLFWSPRAGTSEPRPSSSRAR